MAKRKIKVRVNGELVVAPVWELDNLQWNDNKLGCPYCGIFTNVQAELDIIQFGLENNDSVHTVIKCPYCNHRYAMHYINTQEVEE